jgi:hypothetical protein
MAAARVGLSVAVAFLLVLASGASKFMGCSTASDCSSAGPGEYRCIERQSGEEVASCDQYKTCFCARVRTCGFAADCFGEGERCVDQVTRKNVDLYSSCENPGRCRCFTVDKNYPFCDCASSGCAADQQCVNHRTAKFEDCDTWGNCVCIGKDAFPTAVEWQFLPWSVAAGLLFATLGLCCACCCQCFCQSPVEEKLEAETGEIDAWDGTEQLATGQEVEMSGPPVEEPRVDQGASSHQVDQSLR